MSDRIHPNDCDKTGCLKIKYVCECCGRTVNKIDITKTIEDAVTKAVEETTKNLNHTSRSVHSCERGMKQARAQAFARAAEMAENEANHESKFVNPGYNEACETIAQAIRAEGEKL